MVQKMVTIAAWLAVIVLVGAGGYIWINYGVLHIPLKSTEKVATSSVSGVGLSQFTVAPGFNMNIFAEGVPGARVIIFDPKGTLLVSQTGEGKIVGLPDINGDGRADKIVGIAEGLKHPHGLAFKCVDSDCTLYVAEEDALYSYVYDADTMSISNKKKLVSLPTGEGHYTRTLMFMPSPQENILLVSIGSSCNVCVEKDPARASIQAFDTMTGLMAPYATGLRNSVFMAISPVTGAVWATENGRDGIGDDIPPDEINVIEKGKDYGWPNCYGQNIHDTSFDKKTNAQNPCMTRGYVPAKIDLPAHSAALGMTFVPEEGWPEDMWYDALVAYHGSWNRTALTGYKIVRLPLDGSGKPTGEPQDFVSGWLRPDNTTIGRPADVFAMSGGVVYISDDQAGTIYKVTRSSIVR